MKKLLLGSMVLAAVIAGPAIAAEMPVKAPVKAVAPPPAVYDWSGIYFGVHAGYAWSTFDAAFVGIPNFKVSPDVAIYGGQMGVQHQFGKFVLGVEGSLSAAVRNSFASTDCPPPNNVAFACAARLKNVLTVGPRLGWAMGEWMSHEWMPYVTGGYASATFPEKITIKAAPANPFVDSHQHSGWYIGGGVDMALWRGLTVGLDYRHYVLDSANYVPSRIVAGGAFDPLIGAQNTARVSLDTIMVRGSWKFNRP
jgi:outer membrane immunogenic protein